MKDKMTEEEWAEHCLNHEREHMEYLRQNRLDKVAYPICFWTTNADGQRIIFNALEYLGNGKWGGHDEDGEWLICDGKDLSEPWM